MKKIKTFILGTAAAMVAATGVQAADPIFDIKDPREPVYRCDITGFIELPGTDICFKVGGFAMAGVTFWDSKWLDQFLVRGIVPHGINAAPGGGVLFGHPGNTTQFWSTGRINFDARTATEYGTVRAFIELQAYDNKTRTGGPANLRHAFVQFGNWTIGKAWSTFLHLASSAPATDPYVLVGDNFIRRNMIRYTQPVGNGVTISIALEDQGYGNPGPVNVFPTLPEVLAVGVAPVPFAFFGGVPDRRELPDLVANINVAGAWGSAQLSGALHKNEARTAVGWPNAFEATDSSLGWAVLFGLNLNVPTTEGSNLGFKAVYTDGASQYMQDLHAGFINTIWGTPDALSFLATPGIPPHQIVDDVTQWSLLGWYQHYWTPTVNTSIGVGYAETKYGGSAALVGWAHPTFGTLPVSKVKQLQVFANVEWTPVANTSFMLEGHWGRIDYGDYGGYQALIQATDFALFGTTFATSREDAFSVTLQARRSF